MGVPARADAERFVRVRCVSDGLDHATPVVWEHYYVLLLLSFAVAWRHRDTLPMTAVTAAAVLIMLQRYWSFAIFLRTPFALAFGCAGTLVLWGALVSAARQHVRPGAA